MWTCRISLRPFSSGTPISISRSNRPPRRKAGSKRIDAVGRADDDDLSALVEPVHQAEQLGDDAALHVAPGLATLRGDRVDLVDEDDGRGVLGGLLEYSRSCSSLSP